MENIRKCAIKWKKYSSSIQAFIRQIASSKHLTDVTLVCEDPANNRFLKLKTHKFVLCAQSSYFAKYFANDDGHTSSIFMQGIPYSYMTLLLDFMYFGEIQIPTESLEKFLEYGSLLKIEGLQGITIAQILSARDPSHNASSNVAPQTEPPAKTNPRKRVSDGRARSPNAKRSAVPNGAAGEQTSNSYELVTSWFETSSGPVDGPLTEPTKAGENKADRSREVGAPLLPRQDENDSARNRQESPCSKTGSPQKSRETPLKNRADRTRGTSAAREETLNRSNASEPSAVTLDIAEESSVESQAPDRIPAMKRETVNDGCTARRTPPTATGNRITSNRRTPLRQKPVTYIVKKEPQESPAAADSNNTSWTLSDEVNLISSVQARPPLWNPRDKHYMNSTIRAQRWAEVESVVGRRNCKEKWATLRDSFTKAHRKSEMSKKSGAGNSSKTTSYKHHKLMVFILPYLRQTLSTTSCPTELATSPDSAESGACEPGVSQSHDESLSTVKPTEASTEAASTPLESTGLPTVAADESLSETDLPPVAEVPSTIADVTSTITDVPSTIIDVPSATEDVQPAVSDVTSVPMDVSPTVTDAPPVTDVPPAVADAPTAVTDVPPAATDAPPAATDAPATITNAPPATDITPIASTSKGKKLRSAKKPKRKSKTAEMAATPHNGSTPAQDVSTPTADETAFEGVAQSKKKKPNSSRKRASAGKTGADGASLDSSPLVDAVSPQDGESTPRARGQRQQRSSRKRVTRYPATEASTPIVEGNHPAPDEPEKLTSQQGAVQGDAAEIPENIPGSDTPRTSDSVSSSGVASDTSSAEAAAPSSSDLGSEATQNEVQKIGDDGSAALADPDASPKRSRTIKKPARLMDSNFIKDQCGGSKKRRSNPFFTFSSETRPILREQFPGETLIETQKRLSAMWNELDPYTKSRYQQEED